MYKLDRYVFFGADITGETGGIRCKHTRAEDLYVLEGTEQSPNDPCIEDTFSSGVKVWRKIIDWASNEKPILLFPSQTTSVAVGNQELIIKAHPNVGIKLI